MIIVLLLVLAVVAALAVAGVMMARSRSRQRQQQVRDSRQAAARAAAQQAQQDRRQAQPDGDDDELTSVMPAIKLPWTTAPSADSWDSSWPVTGGQQYGGGDPAGESRNYTANGHAYTAPRGDRYAGFDTGYPEFSESTPFPEDDEAGDGWFRPDNRSAGPGTAAADQDGAPGWGGQDTRASHSGQDDDYAWPGPQEAAGAGPGNGYGQEDRGWPAERGVSAPRPGGEYAPRPGGEHLPPMPRSGEFDSHDHAAQQAEHARRRVSQGSHRGSHGKRRRG